MKNKKRPRIQNFQFDNSFNNFGRDPPEEYARFGEADLVCSFRTECRLKRLPTYGSMLTKTEKMAKIQNLEFHTFFNNFGRYPL